MRSNTVKIAIIGTSGTIGPSVAAELGQDYEIISVNDKSAGLRVDLGNRESIKALVKGLGTGDALICAAGLAPFGHITELTDDGFETAL
jgi:NAD(P)-dependent dehydrogenase (short-subunit alcohol dehydrogenase family)